MMITILIKFVGMISLIWVVTTIATILRYQRYKSKGWAMDPVTWWNYYFAFRRSASIACMFIGAFHGAMVTVWIFIILAIFLNYTIG